MVLSKWKSGAPTTGHRGERREPAIFNRRTLRNNLCTKEENYLEIIKKIIMKLLIRESVKDVGSKNRMGFSTPLGL